MALLSKLSPVLHLISEEGQEHEYATIFQQIAIERVDNEYN